MPVTNLYDRLKAGETINVRTLPFPSEDATREFSVMRVVSEKYPSVHGYRIVLPDGAVPPNHKGMLMDRQEIEDWAQLLEEVENTK